MKQRKYIMTEATYYGNLMAFSEALEMELSKERFFYHIDKALKENGFEHKEKEVKKIKNLKKGVGIGPWGFLIDAE